MCIGEAFHNITPQEHLQEDYTSIMDVTSLRVYQCRVMAILREPGVNKYQDTQHYGVESTSFQGNSSNLERGGNWVRMDLTGEGLTI
jgi:hypothetical protein